MVRPSLLACALLVVGCREKTPAPKVSEGSAIAKPSPNPIFDSASLTPVDGTGPGVILATIAGQVGIDAKGALVMIPSQPDLPGTDSRAPAYVGRGTSLDKLVADLKLPAVARRQAPAIAASGSDDGTTVTEADKQFAALGHPAPGAGVPALAPRLTKAYALAHPFDVSAGVLVYASPAAPAAILVDVLAITGGFVAVKRGSDLGALAFAFDRQEPPTVAPTTPWLELRLGKPGEVALVPGAPVPLDATKLAELVKSSGQTALDILIAPDSTVGDVIHAAELARAAGVVAIGLGHAPAAGSIEQTSRAAEGPRVVAWDFFMQGMDKTNPAPFEQALDATLVPIRNCYATLLAKTKDLHGTAQVEMMVSPTGKVAELQATGVDKALGACAGDVLGKAAFPPVAMPIKLTTQLAFLPH